MKLLHLLRFLLLFLLLKPRCLHKQYSFTALLEDSGFLETSRFHPWLSQCRKNTQVETWVLVLKTCLCKTGNNRQFFGKL